MRSYKANKLNFLIFLLYMTLAGMLFAEEPINRIDRWFVFGTNLAWFKNDYAWDIGPNHASGDLKTSFDPAYCETVFQNLENMGCPLVRIWAFEGQEGLMFTEDLTKDPKYPYHEVTGLDPVFMQNCRTIMETAQKHHIHLYWTLLNHLIREEQGGRHMRIITDPKVRSTYINNAAVPFLKEFANNPAFFAVDIINEAEGAVGGFDALSGGYNPLIGCSWKEMRVFIKECADAFHSAIPGIKVTSTSGYHEWNNLKAGRFSGLGLDFYDWHSYQDNPNFPDASTLGLDKPVIVGECGPKTMQSKGNYDFQGKNWKAYLEQARKGYAGILTWSYGNAGTDNNYVMVNADHTWRPGAKVIFDYANGELFPDAGPILLSDQGKIDLACVNEAVKPILNAAHDPIFVSGKTFIQQKIIKLANQVWNYYPYLNPKYARIQIERISGEITDLGDYEARTNPNEPDQIQNLQKLGSGVLEAVNSSQNLKSLSAVMNLQNFVNTAPSAKEPSSNPFDSVLINAH
ncbi:MAG: hypothetical protein HQM08_19075 [Candidatus Riflebacteria bacterium]|nr:hypothetical protein [Candidatus Riflebacteria bacterium]